SPPLSPYARSSDLRNDRGLVPPDALAFYVDEGVRRPQVNRNVVDREQSSRIQQASQCHGSLVNPADGIAEGAPVGFPAPPGRGTPYLNRLNKLILTGLRGK